jgi:hypothetical protein
MDNQNKFPSISFEEENIMLCNCDFCGVKTKTQKFDKKNNLTKEEMVDNALNPELYELRFFFEICGVCRQKKLQEFYSEM